MELGDQNGGGGPGGPYLPDERVVPPSERFADTGLLGSRARSALRGPSDPRRPGLPRSRWRSFGLLALLVLIIGVALRHHAATCATHPPQGPSSSDARFWVASAVGQVACTATGRAVYGLRDSAGQAMAGLDPVADPRGGYLGVFAAGSKLLLARSTNLLSWRQLAVLDASGASAPTLEPVPGTDGFLLAYQKTRGARSVIRVGYFRSVSALLAAHEATSIDLPLRLSGTANGAPAFLSVAWNGGLRRSQLTLAFTYATAGSGGKPGPSREAIGVLGGFRRWSAQPDTQADRQLDGLGLSGDHGQMRQFSVAGRSWRLYEAQDLADTAAGRQAGWRVTLDDVRAGEMFALKFGTSQGTLPSSFGRPTARVLPAPGGPGQDLVVSMYLFPAGSTRSIAGELLYWIPLR